MKCHENFLFLNFRKKFTTEQWLESMNSLQWLEFILYLIKLLFAEGVSYRQGNCGLGHSKFADYSIKSSCLCIYRFVLTAAHCFTSAQYNDPPNLLIYTGYSNWTSSNANIYQASYKVQRIIQHENFDANVFQNDIALVQTSTSIVFSRGRNFSISNKILSLLKFLLIFRSWASLFAIQILQSTYVSEIDTKFILNKI